MAELVRELSLSKAQGPLFYLKGSTVYGRKPRGKSHSVVELAGFIRSKGYLYYIKNGDLWRAKIKR
jgi:hypothetical protein